MLGKTEHQYLDLIVRPGKIELGNGASQYLYNKIKYRRLSDAVDKRRNALRLKEEHFADGITESLVLEAEKEFLKSTSRKIVFCGPVLLDAGDVSESYEDSTESIENEQPDREANKVTSLRKLFGLILTFAGAVAMLYGINMETSVDAGVIGRVHNLDLANQQRNILIVGAVGVISGLFFLVIGMVGNNQSKNPDDTSNSREDSKKCPACAELTHQLQCAVQRRHFPVGEIPTRQLSFRPVAIGTHVEVTKHVKLPM